MSLCPWTREVRRPIRVDTHDEGTRGPVAQLRFRSLRHRLCRAALPAPTVPNVTGFGLDSSQEMTVFGGNAFLPRIHSGEAARSEICQPPRFHLCGVYLQRKTRARSIRAADSCRCFKAGQIDLATNQILHRRTGTAVRRALGRGARYGRAAHRAAACGHFRGGRGSVTRPAHSTSRRARGAHVHREGVLTRSPAGIKQISKESWKRPAASSEWLRLSASATPSAHSLKSTHFWGTSPLPSKAEIKILIRCNFGHPTCVLV
jgi:hypothetical protein